MDDRRFDEVSKYLSTGVSRKGVLRLLGGVGAAGVAAATGLESTEAKKKGKGKGKGKGKKGLSGRSQDSGTCVAYGAECQSANQCCDRDHGVVCQNPQGGDPQAPKTCNCPGLADGGGKPNFNTDPDNCGRCGNTCKNGETCVAGACKPQVTTTTPPPTTTTAEPTTTTTEAPPTTTTTPQVTTTTPKVGCKTSDDCGDGDVCCGEICVAGDCCVTKDCPEGETCEKHICTPTVGCEKDGDCETGEMCCSNICVVGDCCSTKDCPEGETCKKHVCTPDCRPKTCADYAGKCGTFDNECGGTVTCECAADERCNPGGVCVVIPGCTPIPQNVACKGLQCGPASNVCGVDYECGAGCPTKKKKGQRPQKQTCVSGVCAPFKTKRCIGSGRAGQPCSGKCKCANGRNCNGGRCCEGRGDGSVHCNANNDCCPGLMCAYRRPGQHRVCMPRNAKGLFTESTEATATPGLAVGAVLTGLVAKLGTRLTGNGEPASVAMDEVQIHALGSRD